MPSLYVARSASETPYCIVLTVFFIVNDCAAMRSARRTFVKAN